VPLRRIVSMVAVAGAEFVITRDIVKVEHKEDSVPAVVVALRVRGLVGEGRDTKAVAGILPVNLTCVPEEM
jgi:hypothetical protein